MEFEWDPKKAALNLKRHGVSFQEAATVFGDPLSITAPDPDHSCEENRAIIVGQSHRGRLSGRVTYGAKELHPYHERA